MNLTLQSLVCAIPLATVALTSTLSPGVARAHNASCGEPYYDPCDSFAGWIDIKVASTDKIPIDGVLVLQGAFQGQPPAPESVSLTVANVDEPIAGKLEATDLPGTLIWRPDSPWVAGSILVISGAATNEGADGECLPLELPIDAEVEVDAAPASALSPVNVEGLETEQFSPTVNLDTLACCEGAAPTVNFGGCGGDSIDFDPQQCTPTQGLGFFDLLLTPTPLPTGPGATQVGFRLNAPNPWPQQSLIPAFKMAFLTEPACVSIDLIELGSKQVIAGPEKCFGEGLVDKLGTRPIDASAVLSCDLETCEPNSNSDGWDPENCQPFDPSDPPTTGPGDDASDGDDAGTTGGDDAGQDGGDKACACTSDPTPGAGALLLLGALGLTRRRRARV